jgi:hypothetical protein
LRILGLRYVGRHDECTASAIFDDHAGSLEAVRAAPSEDEVGAGLSESGGESDSEPRGCSGDDGDLLIEAEAV